MANYDEDDYDEDELTDTIADIEDKKFKEAEELGEEMDDPDEDFD